MIIRLGIWGSLNIARLALSFIGGGLRLPYCLASVSIVMLVDDSVFFFFFEEVIFQKYRIKIVLNSNAKIEYNVFLS